MILHIHAFPWLDSIHYSIRMAEATEAGVEILLERVGTIPVMGFVNLTARDYLAYVGEEVLDAAYEGRDPFQK